MNHAGNTDYVSTVNLSSFKYKSTILGNLANDEALKKMQKWLFHWNITNLEFIVIVQMNIDVLGIACVIWNIV